MSDVIGLPQPTKSTAEILISAERLYPIEFDIKITEKNTTTPLLKTCNCDIFSSAIILINGTGWGNDNQYGLAKIYTGSEIASPIIPGMNRAPYITSNGASTESTRQGIYLQSTSSSINFYGYIDPSTINSYSYFQFIFYGIIAILT